MTIGELAVMFGAACHGAVAAFFALSIIMYDDSFHGGLATVWGALVGAPVGFVFGGALCAVFNQGRADMHRYAWRGDDG